MLPETGASTLARVTAQGLKVALIGLMAVLIVAGGIKLVAYAQHSAAEAEGVGQTVTVTISKKDTTAAVAEKLHAAGLVQSPIYFKTMMKLKGGSLRPGTYHLPIGLSVTEIITLITR